MIEFWLTNNHVVTEEPRAHAIRVLGCNTYIGRNEIKGVGKFGIWLGSRASSNEVDGNDFEQFKAVVADVMLNKGASDNVVRGTSGSVSDPGAGNQIRGLRRLAK